MATDISDVQPETIRPAWEIAHLFPLQGQWSEEEYLALTNGTNRLVELSNGTVEVLPMPTRTHQLIIAFLYRLFFEQIMLPGKGTVLFAALRVRLWKGKIREPDLVVMLAEHRDREKEAYFEGADLVVEIVSPDDPSHDLSSVLNMPRPAFPNTGLSSRRPRQRQC